MSSRSSSSVSKPARVGGELVVELGQPLGLDLVDRDFEHGGLAAEPAGVLLGERDLDVALLAGAGAQQLLLEAREQPSRPELEQLIAGLAALERRRRRRGRCSRRPGGRRSRPAGPRSRASRSGRAAPRARGRSSRRRRWARAVRPRVPCTRPAGRADGRRSRSRTPAAALPAGRSPTFRSGSPIGEIPASSIASTYQLPSALAQRLVEHRLAAEAADHDGRRNLALAEAGHAHLAPELARGLLHAALDFLGRDLGLDPNSRLRQFGDAGLDRAHDYRTIAWRRVLAALSAARDRPGGVSGGVRDRSGGVCAAIGADPPACRALRPGRR